MPLMDVFTPLKPEKQVQLHTRVPVRQTFYLKKTQRKNQAIACFSCFDIIMQILTRLIALASCASHIGLSVSVSYLQRDSVFPSTL